MDLMAIRRRCMAYEPFKTLTATGNPAVFATTKAKRLVECKAAFLPVQSGEGDPSPSNVRPITGWTGLNVTHTGKNMLDVNDTKKLALNATYSNWTSTNGVVTLTGYSTGGYIMPCTPNTEYSYSWTSTYTGTRLYRRVYEFSAYPTSLTGVTPSANWDGNKLTFTTKPTTNYLVVGFYYQFSDTIGNVTLTNLQVEVGSTKTDYESHTEEAFPVSWTASGAVYGGYVDLLTGQVWKTWETALLNDKTQWAEISDTVNFIYNVYFDARKIFATSYDGLVCSAFPINNSANVYMRWTGATSKRVGIKNRTTSYTLSDIQTMAENGDIQIAYELTNPVLVTTLTPAQIPALKGNNVIWSDANGDMTIQYITT